MVTRIGLVALSVLVVGCNSNGPTGPFVGVADDEVPSSLVIHYYMTADSAVMEWWVDSSYTPSVDSNWQEVTLTELHNAGLQSPSENLADALQGNGVVSEDLTTGGTNYRSYITTKINPKSVTCGSETWRSWWNPGWLRTRGTSYCQWTAYYDWLTDYVWCWRSYVQAKPKSYPQNYYWEQRGAHWFWNDGRGPLSSVASCYF
jgi:hypothetical protein